MTLNSMLPHFELLGTDGEFHSTDDYDSKDIIVLIFTCNHCPHARGYIDRIHEMVEEYEKLNVGFYAINSNDANRFPEDSFQNMIPMASLLNLEGKYLIDETQEIAREFSASRTPEVFVFNKEKMLVYHGAIDDNTKEPDKVTKRYLIDALDALLENKPIEIQETASIGCTIKWKITE